MINSTSVGKSIYIRHHENNHISLINHETLIRKIVISNKIDRKMLVIDAVNLGAKKSYLASALKISRQTIDNYINVFEIFGYEGLIHSYNPKVSKNIKEHRKDKAHDRNLGNKVREVEKSQKERKKNAPQQLKLPFEPSPVKDEDQPYSQEHQWIFTRYAGLFIYIMTLISQHNWLKNIQDFFGDKFRVFLIFMFMAGRNIRSIEQLKNIRQKEIAALLGLNGEIITRNKTREWCYQAASIITDIPLKDFFFKHQIQTGIVGCWLLFTDGHLLPYTGKQKLRHAYNTQRRLPVPGRTNMVTTDHTGRIYDFDIQEGKGDIKQYIIDLDRKWRNHVSHNQVHVFDREGYSADFFAKLNQEDISFITWEKNIDAQKMKGIDDSSFGQEFKFNGKSYRVFEDTKKVTSTLDDGEEYRFVLRKIYIWNMASNRKTAGLSNTTAHMVPTQECAQAILNRWGASENTFKHLNEKHPLHHEPGFSMQESSRQDMANPVLKEMKKLVSAVKKTLNGLYKKYSKSQESKNKDGTPRKNSAMLALKSEIDQKEADLQALQAEIKDLPERVDATELEDYRNFSKISNQTKNLFDCTTSLVWNARKQMVEWLGEIYTNKNEYVDLFYAISNCHGWIKSDSEQVTVELEPLDQPSRRAAQEQFCRKLTSLKAKTPTGKLMVIGVSNSNK